MGEVGSSVHFYIFSAVTMAIVAAVSWAHIRSKWDRQKRAEAEKEAAIRYRLREMNRLSRPL